MNVVGGLAAANPWVRLSVFLGGPIMNLLTGIILFSIVFIQTGAPDQKTVQVIDVSASSPAQQAGLQSNDIIKAINGTAITGMTQLTTLVHNNIGKEITITYQRDGQTVDIKVTPRVNPPQGQGALGIVMGNPVLRINGLQALPFGFQMMIDQGKQLILLPGRLIRGQIPADQARVVGPVGMFDIYQSARNTDEKSQTTPAQNRLPAVNTLFLMATISVALGLTNLLPIPALDGGRILFIFPELILRRRIPQQYENMVHLIGFATLLILMVYITAQDIINPIVLP